MPATDAMADDNGARVSVIEGARGAIVSVSVPTVAGRQSTTAAVRGADRRRIGEAVLGEPVLTRAELVGLLDLNPCEGAVRTLDAEQLAAAVQTLTEDAQRAATRAAEHESQAERAVQALADLTEASQQLEAEVVVRRSDLPQAVRVDPETVRVGRVDYATTLTHLSQAAYRRQVALDMLAVAAVLDAEQEEAETRARVEAYADDALAAALPVGAQAAEVVRAVRAAGWTPPAPTEEQTP